ncbi:MAG: hypothetical protein UD936_04945 [Acutalibacteraceae bacterium]|nr:hypothetical protein [Acutalibacteraceae bacterium]
MRKSTLKLFAVLLSATTLTASTPMATATAVEKADNSMIQSQQANAVNTSEAASYPICGCTDCGLEPVGENFSEDIPVIGSAADYYEITGDGEPQGTYSRDCDPMAGLPDSVDNSQSKYFPPINIQGGLPACTIWAQTYYQYTYTMNKELDKISKGENIASPMWVYNFVNRGIMDGSLLEWVYWTLEDQGCPPQSILP